MPLRPLKWYARLAERKHRLESGAFLVEGARAIRQVALNSPESITEILAVDAPPPDLSGYPVRQLTPAQFKEISSATTPQGLAAVAALPEDAESARLPDSPGGKILLLEDIQDPGNTGTLIRTAAAFDFSGIILTDKCADPFSPKCVQSTAGSILSLWLRRNSGYVNMIRDLKANGYTVAAADLNGADLKPGERPNRFVLALGNEAAGLSPALLELADMRFRIPINRQKAESLNVASSGAIGMYVFGY